MEPILVRFATLHGFKAKWDTTLVSFEDDPKTDTVTSTLFDKVLDHQYIVRSKYLFAADGARSEIVRQLQIPLIRGSGQGFAVNVLIEADLSHLINSRRGNLHWILTPEKAHPDYAWLCCLRMVKPWHEWICILLPQLGAQRVVHAPEVYLKRIREFIGDDTIDVKIKRVSAWSINEITAEHYSRGNVLVSWDVHSFAQFL